MRYGMLALLAMTLALIVSFTGTLNAAEKAKAKVGEQAPDFSLKDVRTGEEVKLSDFRDKVVVMTFQSTQCPWNYMRENAGYERVLYPLAEQYKSQDVVFLAVNSNETESAESLKSYAEQHNTPYPILKDPGNKVADTYGGKTTPHFYVVDKQGVLRYVGGFEKTPANPEQCGQVEEKYLVPVIEAVVAGQEPPYTETKSTGCGIKRAS